MNENREIKCPICDKLFQMTKIEVHVNRCMVLNSNSEVKRIKRKRSPSSRFISDKKSFLSNSESLASSSERQETDATHIVNTTSLTHLFRPKSLNDIFGQQHVLNNNSYLYSSLEQHVVPNMILWGPPGCGKTSLAHVIREICLKNPQRYKYVELHAANCNKTELEEIARAGSEEHRKFCKQTVLFIDEIHRLIKKYHGIFLTHIRNKSIILIGATTENPSFFMNTTFLNYCRVIVMEKLETCDLIHIIKKVLNILNIDVIDDKNTITNYCKLRNNGLCMHESTIEWLAKTSDGDARITLNNLQLAIECNNKENKIIKISDIKDQIKKMHLIYDRNGEEHHNIISAMHESIKGYNDSAALYWATRMLMGGENPMFIARRLVRTSSEDTGNADPRALKLAVSTMQACQSMEIRDSEIAIAQCVIYLARAPTYQKTITALKLAKEIISKAGEIQPPVPVNLRHISPKLLHDIDTELNVKEVKRSFMPDDLQNINFL